MNAPPPPPLLARSCQRYHPATWTPTQTSTALPRPRCVRIRRPAVFVLPPLCLYHRRCTAAALAPTTPLLLLAAPAAPRCGHTSRPCRAALLHRRFRTRFTAAFTPTADFVFRLPAAFAFAPATASHSPPAALLTPPPAALARRRPVLSCMLCRCLCTTATALTPHALLPPPTLLLLSHPGSPPDSCQPIFSFQCTIHADPRDLSSHYHTVATARRDTASGGVDDASRRPPRLPGRSDVSSGGATYLNGHPIGRRINVNP
ncbi:hypothetical protein B0H12DRAFT_1330230 [Mycena haematopus]|nr:hypothetical protein B0H12DRAFT_1330230 [Mycena haematopus]